MILSRHDSLSILRLSIISFLSQQFAWKFENYKSA